MLDSYSTRFWSKVDKNGPIHPRLGTRCWLWTKSGFRGYGQITFGGKKYKAHRVAYELVYGSIPEGLFVCHHCDNPPCCNPAHLFLGNQYDNMQDASQKGRMLNVGGTCGEGNGCAKVTAEQVREIRSRYAEGGVKIKSLAEEYRVSYSLIWDILTKKTWKHIK